MNDQTQQYQQLIAKCWADDAFKQQLMANPVATLKQDGVDIPAGLTVNVLENSSSQVHLVIPAKPEDLTDDALGGVGGGFDPADFLL